MKVMHRYHKLIMYSLLGTVTTAINFGLYFIGTEVMNFHYMFANVIAWIFSVFFAFVSNKKYVFDVDSEDESRTDFVSKMFKFYGGRGISLFAETVILFLSTTVIGGAVFLVKLFTHVVVVIMNYFFSKKIVFKEGEAECPELIKE